MNYSLSLFFVIINKRKKGDKYGNKTYKTRKSIDI